MTRLLLAFVTATALLAACGDSPSDPGTDPPATVDTVEVEATLQELHPGDRVQLTARAFDASGQLLTGRRFQWESDAPTVATVSDLGMVTAAAAGEVTIYATTEGVTGGAFLAVTDVELPPVAWIDVHPSGQVELEVGAQLQLTANTYDANGQELTGRTLTWASASPAVATVSATGLITAIAPGDAWISVESEGVLDEMFVRVPDVVDPPTPVDHITLDPVELALPVGETVQLVAQPRDAQGEPLARPVTWSSDNPAYVRVDASGLVTALGVGGADVTATSEGKSATVHVDATHIVDHTLAALDGDALPATLGSFTVPHADGSSTTRSVRVYDGSLTIDHGSLTYEATVRAVYVIPAGWVPIPFEYRSHGTIAVDAATAEITFTPDLGRTFTALPVPTGLEVRWQPDDRISGESTFQFAAD